MIGRVVDGVAEEELDAAAAEGVADVAGVGDGAGERVDGEDHDNGVKIAWIAFPGKAIAQSGRSSVISVPFQS